jgi:hypothetical protein
MSNTHDKLRDLYLRLAQLDQDRANVALEIAKCMGELSSDPGAVPQSLVAPRRSSRPTSFRDNLYEFFHEHPNTVFGVFELTRAFRLSRDDIKSMRGILGRMVKDGHVRRVTTGRYQALAAAPIKG